ncbi:Wzz/FepE/Etk N-terminal domain-containing protein [Caminibacter mediatlanticus]|uniref:UDP-N-acetylmuramoylalanyl-D-glutamate--2, 6-diaminopimelate ligase n=1 Tax=Caminibacter mediatlanticus TB-2 TaxID=391592 RepID=A0AAI9AGJ0_9BACT|nr:Wzz/FepE/Etk N-terminal domain-containing protein [Caminibacter mediatlanticus]EDM23200.1 UDP-N-acetylmuramoylalanyl-D-glutamate--2,6-diaminopimelate ligase [Caminibacter mediatlanticus TB-2]
MNEKKPEVVPIQYVPIQSCYEEDEIDLKDLIKTILRYKKFIFIFTFFITFLAGLYVYFKKPIYEIKANLQAGYINKWNEDRIIKEYFYNPNALIVYIKNTYDNSKNDKIKYPKVFVSLVKNTKDILNIKIDDFSNERAINYLNEILKDINSKENAKIDMYKKIINQKIKILQESKKQLLINKQNYLNKIKSINDSQIISNLLQAIADIQKQVLSINEKIINLKSQLSPLNIIKTQIIGKIEKSNKPVKPKKTLIIIVAFITGLILSIFLVFFIEFIRSLKEEDLQKK